ncbi:TetR/AcrR family transcriptional regulator [Streptacidiphilus jiangxiensis]|uniref:DNA-binding transcriptional regulator, AcrR family n=1 Tax=Streptacidiphilus jiangxiensis TaxID=235985 RepID=A0A1H7HKS5_STRJI|nr:TetR family transcriptional regulator [Streptacidiphilus jiangxiensis]SEK48805.1 DNA-binding transcriptional regulator, AcrR family [Streptacidiphilus jiangxiensis]
MPIEVDQEQRLAQIAEATSQVARERGVRAVTIRAVAQQLGGSTAMITNYLPSRAALMANALRHAEREWSVETEELLSGLTGLDRLLALSQWMCTTERDDDVMRRLVTEIVSESEASDAGVLVRKLAREHRDTLGELTAQAGMADPEAAADVLHLIFRGYWLSTLEDPESWPAERGAAAARIAAALFAAQPPTGQPPAEQPRTGQA